MKDLIYTILSVASTTFVVISCFILIKARKFQESAIEKLELSKKVLKESKDKYVEVEKLAAKVQDNIIESERKIKEEIMKLLQSRRDDTNEQS